MNRAIDTTRSIGLAIAIAALVGCAKPAGVLFDEANKPRWPAAPDPARIAYIGQLSTNQDLKPARPFMQGLGEALFGKKDIHVMLSPFAVCTDNADRIFVADTSGQLVHVLNLNTRAYATWTPTAPDVFTQPVGIAYDPAAGLFVADSINAVIYHFDPDGKYLGAIGQGALKRPSGLAISPQTRRLFVADSAAHQIVVLSLTGELIARVGSRGADVGQFNFPTNLAFDTRGRLYVSDSLNFRVQQFDENLRPLRIIGKQGDVPGYFAQPKGIAIDRDDHIYVVDSRFEAVQIFDTEGRLLLSFGEEGRAPGQFWLPGGIFIDAKNRIHVADSYNRRVQLFEYLPEVKP